MHEIMSRFAEASPTTLPPDPARELRPSPATCSATMADNPRVAAFWLPRFQRFAQLVRRNRAERGGAAWCDVAAEVCRQLDACRRRRIVHADRPRGPHRYRR